MFVMNLYAFITVTSWWARWRLNRLLNRLYRLRPKNTSKFRVTGLYVGSPPLTGQLLLQRASYVESVFIRWRHPVIHPCASGLLLWALQCQTSSMSTSIGTKQKQNTTIREPCEQFEEYNVHNVLHRMIFARSTQKYYLLQVRLPEMKTIGFRTTEFKCIYL